MGMRSWIASNETATVVIITVILLLGNILVMQADGGVPEDTYDITVTYEEVPDGILVKEHFVTHVGNSYHVLYRSFGSTLCPTCEIAVQEVTCSKGTGYVSYLEPHPYTPPETRQTPSSTILGKIESNEIGCYNEYRYSHETVTMDATYLVRKSLVEREEYRHSIFSNDHFHINSIAVQGLEGHDTATNIGRNSWVSADVRTGAIDTEGFDLLFILLLLGISLAPGIIYVLFGRDKSVTVPEYLHTPPKKREPWQVDVLASGTGKIGKNGVAAMLLHLYTAGAATIEQTGALMFKKIRTTLRGKEAPNAKTKELLDILCDDEIETNVYEVNPKSKRASLKKFLQDRDVKAFSKSIYQRTGSIAVGIILIGIAVIAGYTELMREYPFIIFFNLAAYAIILSIPKSVFNKFTGDHYKEFLEWMSFKRMLKDYAQIQRYMKEDHRQWREWLVYGAALGAAEEVLKALGDAGIVDAAELDRISNMHTTSILVAASIHTSSGSSGGGGGFGGGGGGGR